MLNKILRHTACLFAFGIIFLWALSYSDLLESQPMAAPTPIVPVSKDNYATVVWQDVVEFRKSIGHDVVMSEELCESASVRSKEIVNDWSHAGFDVERFDNSFYGMGENLSRLFNTPKEVVPAWINSPAHYDVLVESEYTHGCVACTGTYCTLHLGFTLGGI